MASKQTFECYVCKKAGFPNVRVYLDGKTEDGKTIYKNPDLTPHQHKQGQQQRTDAPRFKQSINSTTSSMQEKKEDTSSTNLLLKLIIAELQRLIKLFEEQQQKQQEHNFSKDMNLLDKVVSSG